MLKSISNFGTKSLALCFIIALFSLHSTQSQTLPQGINYQAVARNSLGDLITNKQISVRTSILDGASNGTVLYSETFTPTTNVYGLFTIQLGRGKAVSGTFASIPWSNANQWLKIEIDPDGSNNYVMMGASELLSVPFALYA